MQVFDAFGTEFNFYSGDASKSKSLLGALMTLIMASIIILYGTSKVLVMLGYNETRMLQILTLDNLDHTFVVSNDMGFNLAYALVDFKRGYSKEDMKDYVKLRLVAPTWNEDLASYMEVLEHHSCNFDDVEQEGKKQDKFYPITENNRAFFEKYKDYFQCHD